MKINPCFYIIAIAYILLASVYSITTPIFEASDELWHYPMVKYLADNGLQLPPQDPLNPGPWRQEGSQPPLYYMIAAVLTSGIDTSDMDTIRRSNPHADIGIIRPDGNVNMMVHNAELEAFPWQGTVLAIHIVRFFSVMLGLGTVWVTYLLAKEILPDVELAQLGAAALVGFLPMFLFISGSVNNDNLSNFLGNLLILLIVRLLKVTERPHWRSYILLGIVTGAGLLAKFNIGFLIPIVALALLITSLRLRDWRPIIIGGALSAALTIAIAGWWYWRNFQLYGDPTGLNMFLDVVGRRAVPANAAQIWSERSSFTQAFWGFFGGMNVALPDTIYLIFNLIGGLGLLSALAYVIVVLVRPQRMNKSWRIEHWLAASVTVFWPVVSFISYLRWTAETPASQGRLMFGALSCIILWLTVGLIWWLPQRIRPLLIGGTTAYFLIIAIITPFVFIAPAYAKPEALADIPADIDNSSVFTPPITFQSREENQAGRVNLLYAYTTTEQVYPEDYAEITLGWQVKEAFAQNWSVFVHLVTPDGVIISQRDIYPGGGTLATTDLPADYIWQDTIAVWVPATAYAPQQLDIQVGWYNLQTGERLMIDADNETQSVANIELLPREDNPSNVPNPIRVNFGNQIELVGYELTDLSPEAGDSIELTLYWRALQKMNIDYKVFTSIIDPPTLTKYAAADGMPVNWQAPTSSWEVGTIIEDTHTLTIDPNALPGIYEVELGLYKETDGQRLRVFTPDGGQADNFIYLNRVRITLPQGNGSN